MAYEWISEYGFVILFYLAIILLIYFNRKKFHFEGKIVAMYKTKIGLKLMDKIGYNHPRTVRFLGVVGIVFGYIGMLLMVAMIVYGLYLIVFVPSAPPLFSPVLPGVPIPGSPVKLPLLEGLIALFVVVVVHEFSHGVMSRAYKIPVKSSGFVMFGPLPGAFVEPDEKKLKKSSKKAQLSIFAAGPFSNILLFFIIFGIWVLLLSGAGTVYQSQGILVAGYVNTADSNDGARLENLSVNDVIIGAGLNEINSVQDLQVALINVSPGDTINLKVENKGIVPLTLTSNPQNESLPYLGLMLDTNVSPKDTSAASFWKFMQAPIFWIIGLIYWIWVLSLGIGIVNLLPIGPVDGGRMYLLTLEKYAKKKRAMAIWANTAKILLVALVILIFVPIIKAIFGL